MVFLSPQQWRVYVASLGLLIVIVLLDTEKILLGSMTRSKRLIKIV